MNVERQNQDTLYQMEFDFDTPPGEVRLNGSDRGGIPRREPLKEHQAFAAWREELNWEERILENIAHRYNLEHACQRVKSNKGAPGIDGMTVEELERWLSTHMAELREQLLNGSYRPQEVKGVSIPKPNGGRRQLGHTNGDRPIGTTGLCAGTHPHTRPTDERIELWIPTESKRPPSTQGRLCVCGARL